MSGDNATSFGRQASHYASARPSYPFELFRWIASNAPDHNTAWDVGTGQGQAARSLSKHFTKVIATDLDPAQVAKATSSARLRFITCPADKTPIETGTASVITAATCLHWFYGASFWAEVARVAKPNALFCAWTYHKCYSDAEVHAQLLDPILELIDPYWSEGNRMSWEGYAPATIGMPFEEIEMPHFSCELRWTAQQISQFCRSWSATQRAVEAGRQGDLDRITSQALHRLGPEPRSFKMPLHRVAGRVP